LRTSLPARDLCRDVLGLHADALCFEDRSLSVKITIEEINTTAENLKSSIWEYFRVNKIDHKGVRNCMNELLDCLEECPEWCDKVENPK
jgi:hypothetical protein